MLKKITFGIFSTFDKNALTCKVGLDQLNQANLHLVRHEFKRRPKIKEQEEIQA